MHNRSRVEVFCYALSPNDGSQWRQRIEAGTEHFIDASSWGTGEVCAHDAHVHGTGCCQGLIALAY